MQRHITAPRARNMPARWHGVAAPAGPGCCVAAAAEAPPPVGAAGAGVSEAAEGGAGSAVVVGVAAARSPKMSPGPKAMVSGPTTWPCQNQTIFSPDTRPSQNQIIFRRTHGHFFTKIFNFFDLKFDLKVNFFHRNLLRLHVF